MQFLRFFLDHLLKCSGQFLLSLIIYIYVITGFIHAKHLEARADNHGKHIPDWNRKLMGLIPF